MKKNTQDDNKLIQVSIDLYNFVHESNFNRVELLRIFNARDGVINYSLKDYSKKTKQKKLQKSKNIYKYRGDF